jgi:hypothetical protein
MNVFNEFLDGREASRRTRAEDAAEINWLAKGQAPEARLIKFDTWVRRELQARLQWPKDEQKKAKLIEQCRVELERLVLELWRRGWMLDGARLSKHILRAIDDIAAAQKAGRVKDLWPFFRSVVGRYVGLNSEEIQTESKSAGSLISQALSVMTSQAANSGPTLPELVAQRRGEIAAEKPLRARIAAERKKKACTPDAMPLFEACKDPEEPPRLS